MTFDDIEIDLERYELRKSGTAVAVEPKVFDLIRYLAQNANRLVTKDEMIEAVWDGRIVSDAALFSAIKSARRAMGETDVATSRIKTVRGRGFRMELPDISPPARPDRPEAVAAKVFVQPSFAVLPPRDLPDGLNGDRLQRRISTAMAGVPFLTVIAPTVARRLVDASPEDMARTIGRGYALELTGHEGALDCVLFEVETSATLWSHTCATDGLDEEGVVEQVLLRLEPQIVGAIHTALTMSPERSEPRALTMQALGTMSLKGWNTTAFREAETLLRQAVEADPELGYARAALSLVMALGQRIGLVEPDEARRQEAIAHAEKAIEIAPNTPNILGLAGCALVDAGQVLRGKAVLERGVSLDPNNAQSLAALGTARIIDKRLDEAVEMLTRAIRISPNDGRLAVWGSMLGIGCMAAGDLDRAMVEAERAVAADDRTHLSRVVLAAIALTKGDEAAARDAWGDAFRVTPDLTHHQVAAVIGDRLASDLAAAFNG